MRIMKLTSKNKRRGFNSAGKSVELYTTPDDKEYFPKKRKSKKLKFNFTRKNGDKN